MTHLSRSLSSLWSGIWSGKSHYTHRSLTNCIIYFRSALPQHIPPIATLTSSVSVLFTVTVVHFMKDVALRLGIA